MKILKAFAAAAALVMLTGCGEVTSADMSVDTAMVTDIISEAEETHAETVPSVADRAAADNADAEITVMESSEASEEAVPDVDEAIIDDDIPSPSDDVYPDGGGSGADAAEYSADIIFPPFSHAEAKGDIITINVTDNYLDCNIRYGRLVLMEEESTSSVLYFQAVSEGKDNIVISENSPDGVILREYIATIDEDLTVTLVSDGCGFDRSGFDRGGFDDGIMPLIEY